MRLSYLLKRRPPFTVNFSPTRFSLNPQYGFTTAEAQIYTALYEGLVSYHPANLLPQPGIAESWEIDEDGTLYTFHLRKDLKWSNGDALTASQLRQSWIRLLSPDVAADYASLLDDIPGAKEYRHGSGKAEDVAIEAPDDRTFIVHLKQKVPYFLQILCHYSFVPIHPSLLNQENWWELEDIPGKRPVCFLRRNKSETDQTDQEWTVLGQGYPENKHFESAV